MAETILTNTSLTPVLPDSAKTFVYSGGTLAILPEGAVYATGLVKIPIGKFTFTPKVEFGKKYGIDPVTKLKTVIRTWAKSVEYSAKITCAEARNAFVATLATSGYVTGKFKLLAKDQSDASTKAALVIGEFTGTIMLDGDYGAEEGESPDVSFAIEITGTPAFAFDATIAAAT